MSAGMDNVMMLVRERVDGDAVIGSLFVHGHKICDTMENRKKLVPTGYHQVMLTRSPKFKRVLPLIFSDTIKPNRGIRIHAGNRPSDSAGCVLVGVMKGKLLTDSRRHEEQVVGLLQDYTIKPCHLVITSLLAGAIPA